MNPDPRQFTVYRTDWRNPSTHDYLLDFDESEAFLAIVSVCAFACVLIDQIEQKVAFELARKETSSSEASSETDKLEILDEIADAVLEFSQKRPGLSDKDSLTDAELSGALHGYLSKRFPNLAIMSEQAFGGDRRMLADFILNSKGREIIVEVKRFGRGGIFPSAKLQIEGYLEVTGISDGILLLMPEAAQRMEIQTYSRNGKKVVAILPRP